MKCAKLHVPETRGQNTSPEWVKRALQKVMEWVVSHASRVANATTLSVTQRPTRKG